MAPAGLSVGRRGRTVLHDAPLTAVPGELHVVVGPNGAGKSTLLAALAGDVSSDPAVLLDGVPVRSLPAPELARRRAVLLQQSSVAFGFTVAEVVAMGRHPWPVSSDAGGSDADVLDRAVADADVGALLGRRASELSGGEAARVALARVLAQDTPVLLLDEPTAALDLGQAERVVAMLARRARGGTCVVAAVHDLTLAAAHADRVTLLAAGRTLASGPAGTVLTPELLRAAYGWEVDVVDHPVTGRPLVLPRSGQAAGPVGDGACEGRRLGDLNPGWA